MSRKRTRFDKAVETRRIYRFEGWHFYGSSYSKQRKMKYLKSEMIYIWRKMKFEAEMPRLRAGKGVLNNGYWYSYYSINDGIVLSRSQRNIVTLVHEIVHHLGHDEHDSKFVKQYFNIFRKCYKFTEADLQFLAWLYKLPY
jgi:hypothetical protein